VLPAYTDKREREILNYQEVHSEVVTREVKGRVTGSEIPTAVIMHGFIAWD
jgi:hypothetical protein